MGPPGKKGLPGDAGTPGFYGPKGNVTAIDYYCTFEQQYIYLYFHFLHQLFIKCR